MDSGYQSGETAGSQLRQINWHHEGLPFVGSDKIASEKTMKKNDRPDLGVIEAMSVPASWRRFAEDSANGRAFTFQPAKSSDAEIGFLQHGEVFDQKGAQMFHRLLGAPVTMPRLLYSDAQPQTDQNIQDLFKGLASVLGKNTVGDNQLTNSAKYPDPRCPSFHLESARLEKVNGKTVLAVDGWFRQDDDFGQTKLAADKTPEKRRYSGIFLDADGSGANVQELYFSGDDKASYLSNKSVFRSALRSIRWQ